jgi:hypothetical protein
VLMLLSSSSLVSDFFFVEFLCVCCAKFAIPISSSVVFSFSLWNVALSFVPRTLQTCRTPRMCSLNVLRERSLFLTANPLTKPEKIERFRSLQPSKPCRSLIDPLEIPSFSTAYHHGATVHSRCCCYRSSLQGLCSVDPSSRRGRQGPDNLL